MKNPTPYRVECDVQGKTYFEVIAAFNCAPAARNYAIECAKAHGANLYRVTLRKKVLNDPAYIKGEAILDVALGAGTKEGNNAHA